MIVAWWSATKPRSFSIAIFVGTGVTSVCCTTTSGSLAPPAAASSAGSSGLPLMPLPSCTTWLRPFSLAMSKARSARRSIVSAVSPGWISVTPKLTVIALPFIIGCGICARAMRTCSARRQAVVLSQSAMSMTNSSPPYRATRSPGWHAPFKQGRQALDRLVARLVPVAVVDQLEAVQVAHQQRAGDLLLLVGG